MCNSAAPACPSEWLGILDERGSADAISLDFMKGSIIGMDFRFLDFKKTKSM